MQLRPEQIRPPAKKITRETLRSNPLLAMLARQRAKEIRSIRQLRKAEQLPLEQPARVRNNSDRS